MNKEEFIKNCELINSKFRELSVQLESLKDEYIKSNSPIPVGSKVRVSLPADDEKGCVGTEAFGIITNYYIGLDDNVWPTIMQIRKDGKPSKNREVWYHKYRGIVIEACD